MAVAQCPSCATLSGINVPPGGILYDDSHWVVFLRAKPLLVPGQGFLVLKWHCEHLSELTPAELAALGPMLQHIQCAYDQVLQPAKLHFGLYAEAVKHLHLHIIPRDPLARTRMLETLAWMNNTVHPTFTHAFMPHKFAESDAAKDELRAFNTTLYRGLMQELDALVEKAQREGKPYLAGEHFGPPDAYTPPATPQGQVNITDPDSRVVKGSRGRGFLQATTPRPSPPSTRS